MLLYAIVTVVLPISIWLVVFSLGAKASFADATFVISRPRLLLRALIALFVVVPAFALLMSSAFSLSPAIRFALVALAVSPIPPALPRKQMNLGASQGYVIGLLVAASLGSLIATPLLVALSSNVLGVEAAISVGETARLVGMSVGLPLGLGIAIKAAAPGTSAILSRYANMIGSGLLAIGVLAVLIVAWRSMIALVGDGAILAMIATIFAGLLAGHLLAGHEDASGALALAAATRHPGVAIAIAAASFPEQKQIAMAAVVLFVVVNALVTAPYVRWMKHRAESPQTGSHLGSLENTKCLPTTKGSP